MFGIIGIEYELPSLYIDQKDVAEGIGMEEGKIRVGLGIEQMGVPAIGEDAVSLAMGAVSRLIKRYKVDLKNVGRLEVGTESGPDSAKSVKSYLMELFEGNSSICGCDVVHACYGATAALFNTIAWMESSFWDGRFGIVVASDVAFYEDRCCQATGGGGAVAILIGPSCVYRIIPSSVVHYSANEFDFMKPKERHPFPTVSGKESVENYSNAFGVCYDAMKKNGEEMFERIVLHTPYPRLPEKMCERYGIPLEKLAGALDISRRNGNAYTASVYLSLVSLIGRRGGAIGETINVFSYGSGLTSTMFCLERMKEGCVVEDPTVRLDRRRKISYSEFLEIVGMFGSASVCEEEKMESGRFYLRKVVGMKRCYESRGE